MIFYKHKRLIKIIIAILIPLAIIAIIVYIKFFYKIGSGIECFTYKYFRIYCMGCGSARQLYFALNGQFEKAFYYNVCCVIIYPAYAYLYYLIMRWVIKDKKIDYKQAYILAIFAGVLIIYMVLRNIPIDVFDILRPLG